jgi:hypothetical protein
MTEGQLDTVTKRASTGDADAVRVSRCAVGDPPLADWPLSQDPAPTVTGDRVSRAVVDPPRPLFEQPGAPRPGFRQGATVAANA